MSRHIVKNITEIAVMLDIGQMDTKFLLEEVVPDLNFHEFDVAKLKRFHKQKNVGAFFIGFLSWCQDNEVSLIDMVQYAQGGDEA